MTVQVVHQIDESWVGEVVIAEQMAHMAPVLLLSMGIVVFLVGP